VAHRSRESTHSSEEPPIRNPRTYALTDHFRKRLAQPGRYVSIATASDAIRRGQLRWNTDDGWRFAVVEDGVRFVVVVGDTDTDSPVVVTGWTEVADWDAAMDSSRWNETDVHTIRLRTALSEHPDDRIPGRIRPHGIQRPFEIGHHRVTSTAGASYLECRDCHRRFRSKSELTQRLCR